MLALRNSLIESDVSIQPSTASTLTKYVVGFFYSVYADSRLSCAASLQKHPGHDRSPLCRGSAVGLANSAALRGICDELGTICENALSLARFLAYTAAGRSHSPGNLKDGVDSVLNLTFLFCGNLFFLLCTCHLCKEGTIVFPGLVGVR